MSNDLTFKTEIEPAEPPKLHESTKRYRQRLKDIKDLVDIGKKTAEIAKLLSLNKNTVSQHKKTLKMYDLTNSKNVSLAHKALTNNLKNDNMKAVELVYNQVHKESQTPQLNQQRITVNINFDGLSNPQGFDVINGKAKRYSGAVQEGIIIESNDAEVIDFLS
jgi:DNA-binding CsgD family transcriptional regulator